MDKADLYFQFIINNAGTYRIEELGGIYRSIVEAIEADQYLEINDGKLLGFVTWEIRPNEQDASMIDIGVNNLVLIKSARGTYPLMRVTNYLRSRYPNVASFVWKSRKRNKFIEIKQRGNHVTNTQENLQFTR